MENSILTSTKKQLGVAETYTDFDLDITLHINSAFSNLHQLGVGPVEGFMIEDKMPLWADFSANNVILNSAKSYIYLYVRMLFDPPGTSYHINAMQEQLKELTWRLQVASDPNLEPTPVLTDPIL